jgi:hypothetical protein
VAVFDAGDGFAIDSDDRVGQAPRIAVSTGIWSAWWVICLELEIYVHSAAAQARQFHRDPLILKELESCRT